jgi:regulator of sirC expression with transglutaminase-like and TPR domain
VSESFDPIRYLQETSLKDDAQIDVAKAALAIAAKDRPGISIGRYLHHLQSLGDDLKKAHDEALAAGHPDDAATRLGCLRYVFYVQNTYNGDRETYDDLQNADLTLVIDRRKGLPVALSILCVSMARANGWMCEAIDFPGHVFCRIECAGQRLLFDPFDSCRVLEASDLRALLKKTAGVGAELSADFLKPMTNRAMLIRLQNNIKYRQIAGEDYAGALKTVETMRLIDPKEYRLYLDAGILYARENQAFAAIRALENYIAAAPKETDTRDAQALLAELKGALN